MNKLRLLLAAFPPLLHALFFLHLAFDDFVPENPAPKLYMFIYPS